MKKTARITNLLRELISIPVSVNGKLETLDLLPGASRMVLQSQLLPDIHTKVHRNLVKLELFG